MIKQMAQQMEKTEKKINEASVEELKGLSVDTERVESGGGEKKTASSKIPCKFEALDTGRPVASQSISYLSAFLYIVVAALGITTVVGLAKSSKVATCVGVIGVLVVVGVLLFLSQHFDWFKKARVEIKRDGFWHYYGLPLNDIGAANANADIKVHIYTIDKFEIHKNRIHIKGDMDIWEGSKKSKATSADIFGAYDDAFYKCLADCYYPRNEFDTSKEESEYEDTDVSALEKAEEAVRRNGK